MSAPSTPKILVAGIGNIFHADDGFGVAVASALLEKPLSPDIQVLDIGIRGHELAYMLLEREYELVILIDAISRNRLPGTLYVLDPLAELPAAAPQIGQGLHLHGTDPYRVLEWVRLAGGRLNRVLIIGCEPEDLGSDEEVSMGLSPAVRACVAPAATLILEKITEARLPCMS